MPLQLHRAPPPPRPTPTRSQSGSEVATSTAMPDNASVYSFFSSSDHTAVSGDHSTKDLPAPPKYSYDLDRSSSVGTGAYGYPSDKKEKYSEPPSWAESQASKPAVGHSTHRQPSPQPFAQSRIALTTTEELASALGQDNTPYSIEIDVLPCAGVRIPYGPLTGQLAWRMVVHAPLRSKDKHRWFSNGPDPQDEPCTCVNCKHKRQQASKSRWSYEHRPCLDSRNSSISLPLDITGARSPPPKSAPLPQPRTAYHPQLPRVVANFIFDSSLPHSIISRETLTALGVREASLPGPQYDPHGEDAADDERRGEDVVDTRTQLVFHISKAKHHGPDRRGVVTGVTLSVQGVKTRVRVGRVGEASRLGVQFLKDAGASLIFPGDGVGPVLYLESMGAVQDAPRTVVGLPRWKNLTLPQRVKLILGLGPTS